MRLAEFIEQNARQITDEAAAFAETQAPPGVQLSADALRDHIPGILAAIVLDLRTPQEPTQQRAKSEGRAPQCTGPESAASGHGRLRAKDGFDVNRMIAEYRALRATVLRLWIDDEALTKDSIEDLIRFNEAIDQAAAESLADFTKEVESWRKMLLGVLGHDLRGPLSAIVGTSEVLSRMAMGTSYSVLAERLTEGAMRMSKLLNDLLAYNRTQLGIGIALNRSVCDLREVLKDEIDLLSESPRDWWRLQLLRRWSHEQIEQVLPGSPRARRAYGARASW